MEHRFANRDFKQHADDNVHGLFTGQEKLTNSGFDLHHTAVLAAPFECRVHADCVERPHIAYRMLGFSVMHVQGMNQSTIQPHEFARGLTNYGFIFAGWTRRFFMWAGW